MCTQTDWNNPPAPPPHPHTHLKVSFGVHTPSCSKSCLGAAALGCVIAELQCPRWLNTLTVEYSAQHFYSQHNWRGDGKMNAKLPPPPHLTPYHPPHPPPPLCRHLPLRLKPSHRNIFSFIRHSRSLSSPAGECGHGDGT